MMAVLLFKDVHLSLHGPGQMLTPCTEELAPRVYRQEKQQFSSRVVASRRKEHHRDRRQRTNQGRPNPGADRVHGSAQLPGRGPASRCPGLAALQRHEAPMITCVCTFMLTDRMACADQTARHLARLGAANLSHSVQCHVKSTTGSGTSVFQLVIMVMDWV